MRYILLLLLLACILTGLPASQAQTVLSFPQKRQYALDLLKKYDSDGWYVVTKMNELSYNNNFDRYADSHTKSSVRDALGTIVHELNHGYSALMAWKIRPRERDQYACYYIGDTTHILVKYTPVFLTEEIGKEVRPELHTFRFDTYIYNAKEKIQITSNVLGIYGLLDEWNAYYHGTKTDVYMYKWYEEHSKNTVEDWRNYFSTVGSVVNAYVEFKFYCLTYLLHAQKYKPDVYQGIMNNPEFIEVFRIVDQRYGKLVNEYLNIKKSILKKLQNKGVKVSEDEEWIFMNGEGTGNFVNEYKVLSREMEKPQYQEMLKNLEQFSQASRNK